MKLALYKYAIIIIIIIKLLQKWLMMETLYWFYEVWKNR